MGAEKYWVGVKEERLDVRGNGLERATGETKANIVGWIRRDVGRLQRLLGYWIYGENGDCGKGEGCRMRYIYREETEICGCALHQDWKAGRALPNRIWGEINPSDSSFYYPR